MALGLNVGEIRKFLNPSFEGRDILLPPLPRELAILEENKPLCFYEGLPTTFDTENLSRLGEAAEEFFYNPNFLLFLSCLVTSMVSLGKVANVKNWLDNSKALRPPKENLIEIITSLGDVRRNLLLDSSPILNLTYEALVGRLGTNVLRESIPNFIYIYGGFSCAPPIVYKKKVYDYCWEDRLGGYNYLLQERIRGESLAKRLKYISVETFLNYFVQILLSLNLANRSIGYTHYSLRAENILLRELTSQSKFGYDLEGGRKVYLVTGEIATIANYQTSFFRYQGELFLNRPKELTAQVGETEEFPLFDVYTLLRDVYQRSLRLGYKELVNVSLALGTFFSPQSKEFLENIPYLPPHPQLIAVKLETFLRYISQLFPLPFVTDNPQGELSCKRIECLSIGEIRKEYDFIEEKSPEDAYSLYVDYLNLPHDVLSGDKEIFIRILVELGGEAESIKEDMEVAKSLADYIKLTKRWREFAMQIRELEEIFRNLDEDSAFEAVDFLRKKYAPLGEELSRKDRELARTVLQAGELTTLRNPLKYSRYKNLYDYLNF